MVQPGEERNDGTAAVDGPRMFSHFENEEETAVEEVVFEQQELQGAETEDITSS